MSDRETHQRNLTTGIITGAVLLVALGVWLGFGRDNAAVATPGGPLIQPPDPAVAAVDRPRIDVVFALDTTGSMDGLIAGAKAKIWALASRIAAGKPTPDLRIGLVAYRDRGDEYVTRVFPLSRNMDEVYGNLMSFSANAGGDRNEDVIQALSDSVHKMQWDKSGNALRIIFLVGDSPAHQDYGDEPSLSEISRQASAAGIIVNSIRCGDAGDTEAMWKRVAAWTGGGYASVAQSGGWMRIDTPYDATLSRLNADLTRTFVAYGDAEERTAAKRRMETNAAMPAPAQAASAGFRARSKFVDSADALSILGAGGKVDGDKLGGALAGKSPAEQQALLKQKQAEREALNKRIAEVAKKRDAYLKGEMDKRGGGGMESAVDGMLRIQAKKVGVRY
jgi:hypothetical protein